MREFLSKLVPEFLADPLWWRAAIERAVKTAGQVAALVILATGVNLDGGIAVDFASVDWGEVGRFAAGGAVLSLLTSLGSGYVGERGTPSLTKAETQPE